VSEPATSDELYRLRRNYTPAFLAHLTQHDEKTLRSAYELGRHAMAAGLSTLDLVDIHHGVFSDVALSVRDVDELPAIVEAATAFLVEALAPFEMTRQPPRSG
jgi:phosphoserine phosphatase RsbU-like protein